MASEYAPIDISQGNAPDLAALADEVHRTKRPRVLRRADEDIAVISPIITPVPQRQPSAAASSAGIPHYTLEQVFGSVPTPPHLPGKDIDEMIREAKEERAERLMRQL